jgi:phosphatidylethanolamine-binding protein (PEBP) family uncharacterized protein
MKRVALALSAALLSSPAFAMSAKFSWNGIPACSRVSPVFVISDPPKGVASLRFTMRDYDAPFFVHGGSIVPYTGRRVPEGAISYTGPCPPGAERHRYIWKIEALNAAGDVLTATTASGAFPP